MSRSTDFNHRAKRASLIACPKCRRKIRTTALHSRDEDNYAVWCICGFTGPKRDDPLNAVNSYIEQYE